MKRLLFLLLLVPLIARSSCTIYCRVRYLTTTDAQTQVMPGGGSLPYTTVYSEGGSEWSETYRVRVNFYSGYEYNEMMHTNYRDNLIIGVIPWRNGGYTTIFLSRYVTSMEYVDENEILYDNNTGEFIEQFLGIDKVGTTWAIYPEQ